MLNVYTFHHYPRCIEIKCNPLTDKQFKTSIENLFAFACRYNLTQTFRNTRTSVVSNNIVEVLINYTNHETRERGFYEAWKGEHLHIAKELFELDSTIDVHKNEEYAFRSACTKGNWDMIMWFVSKFKPNVHVHDNWAFRWACYNGHLHVAMWLDANYDIPKSLYNEIFRWACYKGYVHMAHWLTIKCSELDVHVNEEWVFRMACYNKHLGIVQLLMNLKDKPDIWGKILFETNVLCSDRSESVSQYIHTNHNIYRAFNVKNESRTFYDLKGRLHIPPSWNTTLQK